MTEERYLEKLLKSYETIIDMQRDKIKALEKQLEDLNNQEPVPVHAIYVNKPKSNTVYEEPAIVECLDRKNTDIPKPERPSYVPDKSTFGSMSNKLKLGSIQDYVANGGVTELKKTKPAPTPVVPTPVPNKKIADERPRAWKRFIYFKSSKEAHEFINRYSKDFEIGKTKKTYWNASETKFELHKNTTNNDLFSKGYLFVLEFSMNGVDFKVLEELENLEGYHQNGAVKKRGGSYKSIRLYKGEKVKV